MSFQERDERTLESWKEIASYLQRDAKTARNWEKEEGLPVHRHSHKSRSSVYAYPSEIDAWRAGRRVVTENPAIAGGAGRAWWRPVWAGVTALLCLMMVGDGVRRAEAAGALTKQNRQIWASEIEDFTESVPSPDGRYLACTDWNTGDLGIRDLRAGKSRRLTKNADWHSSGAYDYAESPVVSPDSRQVAYTWWVDKERRAEIRVSPVNGGAARTLQRSNGYYKLFGWTPDGTQILGVRRGGECQIALISAQDGSERVVKSFDRRDLSLSASISPDGRYVAYDFPQDKKDGPRDIFIVPSGGGEAYEVQHPANDGAPHWSADGSRIVFLSNRTGDASLWSIGIENGRSKGEAELVKTGMGNTVALGITRSGSLQYVVRGSSSSNIYVADLGADLKASARPVRASERFINSNSGAQVSADGKLLSYLSIRPGGAMLVIRDLNTNEEQEVRARNLSVRRVTDYGPMWFPDHRSLLVVGREPQGSGFYRLDVGTGNEELLSRFSGALDGYALSPNGNAIVYVNRTDDPASVRVIRFDVETKKETELKKDGGITSVSVSPDSRQLAYLVTDPAYSVSHLMVMPAEGGESREVFRDSKWDGTERFNGLSWTPDQKFLIFVRAGADPLSPRTLWRVAASGGRPEEMGISFTGDLHSPQVLPDGKRLFFSGIETSPSEVWALENFLPQPAR